MTKTDIGIAKNYLNRHESGTLELLVGQYLDLAEMQARQRKVMTMKDWIDKLDAFLKLNNQEILSHAGVYPFRWDNAFMKSSLAMSTLQILVLAEKLR